MSLRNDRITTLSSWHCLSHSQTSQGFGHSIFWKNFCKRANIRIRSYIGNHYPTPTVRTLISASCVKGAHLTRTVEIIQLQTLLKLRKLGYTMSQIDAEMVLPTADADPDGLLCVYGQRCASRTCLPTLQVTIVRDLLEWPGMLKNTGNAVDVIEKWDVRKRVDSMLQQFCPLLGCIHSACPAHSTCSLTFSTLRQPLP